MLGLPFCVMQIAVQIRVQYLRFVDVTLVFQYIEANVSVGSNG